ncbi:YhdH/YhfP family quinone oxidoreductase [Loigolactobacillus zhaoyuanensis]|uniref:YhdH/YhfP family quinone oxidoreductase n=1 Tax=Loigolactobacillus zhaoyuanensis TaxID=2486017 RepID=A0ABW8UBJ5_9LACO|nr:YhdH/YhfP family quinone oxidoreductase [Loigolactobacillus zhaoyuanensis]
MKYQALELQLNDTQVTPTFVEQQLPELAADQVTVKVAYSDINYKDALTLNSRSGVLRQYPQIPGIDAAGTVVASKSTAFKVDQKVLLTGFDFGISWPGGYAEFITVPAAWLVPLPQELSLADAMWYGTAGFTAALSVRALLKYNLPLAAPILVTGATGGVGGWAMAILHQLGYYNLTAVSRNVAATDYLQTLGANNVITPAELADPRQRPLQKQKFVGVIDAVGGTLLTDILPQVSYSGIVALSGNAGGNKLAATTLPFILRGIRLQGIDSVSYPTAKRAAVWQQLATDFKPTQAQLLQQNTVEFKQLPNALATFLAEKHHGRTLVRI